MRKKESKEEKGQRKKMSEEQKENVPTNGNVSFDHDEYQYLKLIKNIIETGECSFELTEYQVLCEQSFSFFSPFVMQERSVRIALALVPSRFLVLRCVSVYAMMSFHC